MARYNIITDPGHGWLSVPIEDVERLGIADKISACSYMTASRAYLEEDCDAGIFVDAAGLDYKSIPVTYSDNAKCRSYASYNPAWVHSPFAIGREVRLPGAHNCLARIIGKQGSKYVADAGFTRYGIPASNPLMYCSPA